MNNPPGGTVTAALGDRVLIDTNGNGRQDPDEVVVNNATVTSGLAEMFGEANIDAFKQLGLFARSGRLLDGGGHDVQAPGARSPAGKNLSGAP